MAQQPLFSQGLFIVVDTRSLSYTPHSAALFWWSGQPEEVNSTGKPTDVHATGFFELAIPASMRPFTQALLCGATVIRYYNVYRI